MNNVIQTKSYAFAIRIVNAYKFLIDSKKEYVLTKQVLRSGTAIGALVAEAHYAQSSADFVSKMSIALKGEYDSVSDEMGSIYYKGFSEEEITRFEECLDRIRKNLEEWQKS